MLLYTSSFSQDLAYEVRGKYPKTITKGVLASSNTLSDLIQGYPKNWVEDYVYVEIHNKENGTSAIGKNEVLNPEQKAILSNLDLDGDLEVVVSYNTENSAIVRIDNHKMVVNMTVVPDIKAEFVGGYDNLKLYLKENLVPRITNDTPTEHQGAKVAFTIDETGKVINPTVSETSGDAATDNFIIEVLNKMPTWTPAQNNKGEKVKQKFIFSMGIGGC